MSNLITSHFIAGYKHHPDHEDIHWLGNHPESADLIFNKDKSSAFVFDDEQTALSAINEILSAENHSWYTPIVEVFQSDNPPAAIANNSMSLEQAEEKINEFLELFNGRSNSGLKLFLTLNKKDNTIRGYGTGVKIDDAIINFVALLTVKGLKAQYLDKHTFIVKLS